MALQSMDPMKKVHPFSCLCFFSFFPARVVKTWASGRKTTLCDVTLGTRKVCQGSRLSKKAIKRKEKFYRRTWLIIFHFDQCEQRTRLTVFNSGVHVRHFHSAECLQNFLIFVCTKIWHQRPCWQSAFFYFLFFRPDTIGSLWLRMGRPRAATEVITGRWDEKTQ